MRLTSMTDYSLRLLIYLGRRPDRLCTIAEVAAAHAISEAHLMKITHQLGVGGWIETLRGKGGGMRLARRPADISIGAIVRSMEADFRLVECFDTGSHCTLAGECHLTGIFSNALGEFMRYLDRHTLADLLEPGPGRASLAGTPLQSGATGKILRLPRRPRAA